MTVDKSLLAGSTTMLVLKLLDGQDMYGYQMIEELSRRSERAFALKTGTLYPLLLRLERKGLIAAEYRAGSGGPSRKYYRLTPDGVQYLSEFVAAWQEASDTVNRILHDKEG